MKKKYKKVGKVNIGEELFKFGIATEYLQKGDICYFDKKGRIRKARAKDVKLSNN